jgi:hypothetical protein
MNTPSKSRSRNAAAKKRDALAKVEFRGRNQFVKSKVRKQSTAQIKGRSIIWHGPDSSSSSNIRYASPADALDMAIWALTNLPRCAQCGLHFDAPRRRDAQYCGSKCRQAAYRHRKLETWDKIKTPKRKRGEPEYALRD